MKVWLNGAVLDTSEARIDPSDRGFTLGDGVFETILLSSGCAMHIARHLRRLREGAGVLGIEVAPTDGELGEAVLDAARANGLSDGAVRLTLSRGPAQRGVLPPRSAAPTLLVTVAAMPPGPDSVTAIICEHTRRNERSPLSRIKSLNYLDSVLARMEAAERGCDDALLLNTVGRLAEATFANLFVLRADGAIATPPVSDGALPGIIRAVLIERRGVIETPLRPADLSRAEAVFLASSLGLRSVASVDGQAVPTRPALVTELAARVLRD